MAPYMVIMTIQKTLTGRWMGRYDYDRGGDPVAFEVSLTETGGAITGEVMEPNKFRQDMGEMLNATLDGARSGTQVSFIKRYSGFAQGDHPQYDGSVNAALTRIEGRWQFKHIAGWGGRFMMVRNTPPGVAVERRETVEVGR